jgi:creatinine amidohydrolase
VELLRTEGRDVTSYSCAPPRALCPAPDAHAGRTETSIMLALAPELVRLDLAAAGNTAPLASLLPAMRAGSVRAATENGVLGDPSGATAAEGELLLAAMIDALVAVLA